MRFVIFSDTHRLHDDVIIPDGDVLIFCGDMCASGEFSQVTAFSFFLSKLPHKHKIVIAGNHDFPFELRDPYTLIPNGISYLCDSAMTLKTENKSLIVYGTPWTPQFYNWAFMLPRDGDRLKARVDNIPNRTNILITHGPPKGILDNVPRYRSIEGEIVEYENAGCLLLRERVDKVQPLLHVFGHIHSDYGVFRKDKTLFVNACICDSDYNPVHKPIVLDYINGKFEVVIDE